MIICINYGHALTGPGTGAVGILNESKENRAVGQELVRLLKENSNHKIIVADYNGTDNYVKAVNYANAQKADLFVSIHFNSGVSSANGTEVLVYSLKSAPKEASQINNSIAKLGFKDRGVKARTDLHVLKKTVMPACLVECCFVSSQTDVNKYNSKTMAKAIAEGILGKSISTSTPSTPGTATSYVVVIDTDSLNVRTGPGTNYPVATSVKRGDAYTIIEEKNGWGKLKSGAGWIKLSYTKRK